MFLPLNDEAPTRRHFIPWVTWSIIAVCTIVFAVFQNPALLNRGEAMAIAYGLIPSVFNGLNTFEAGVFHVPVLLTPVTYTFLHGGWMHLVGNMLFLYIFGDNVEAEMGRVRYALFFLGVSAAAGIIYAFAMPQSDSPLIGASGGVSAVLGAYLVLHPHVKVLGLIFNVLPVRIPAFWFICSWFVLQVGHALFDPNQGVAWLAHVVGLIGGALAVLLMRLRPPSLSAIWNH